jgi:hypothetical protein
LSCPIRPLQLGSWSSGSKPVGYSITATSAFASCGHEHTRAQGSETQKSTGGAALDMSAIPTRHVLRESGKDTLHIYAHCGARGFTWIPVWWNSVTLPRCSHADRTRPLDFYARMPMDFLTAPETFVFLTDNILYLAMTRTRWSRAGCPHRTFISFMPACTV